MRRTPWMVALAVLAASCTPGDPGAETGLPRVTTEAPAGTTPPPPTVGAPAGRLAVVGPAGNIVVMDPDGSNEQAMTTDAGSEAFYAQPVWAPDSTRLAWGQVTPTGFSVGIGELATGVTTSVPMENFPFFIHWSPDGAHLGVLRNGTTGVELEMIDFAAASSSVVDTGRPYYFSWSPPGDRLVAHAGARRFLTVSPDGEQKGLGDTDPGYLAPQWTPAGIFHVVEGVLVLESEEGSRSPVVAVPGAVNFVASDDGSHVALQSPAGGNGAVSVSSHGLELVPPGVVAVVAATSGEVEVVGRRPALGFFWSPNGRSLLVLEVAPDRRAVVPRVWQVEGETREYPAFLPVPQMFRDFYPFFPQYAQSVSLWSSDSSAFAFAGAVGLNSGVWVQELDRDEPHRVSRGTWVAWSPG